MMGGSASRSVRRATSFVGRERELAELERLFARARLVSLVGPPGVGKTRAALELCGRVGDNNATQLCELEGTDDLVSVIAALARCSGTALAADASDDLVALAAHALEARGVELLVLDNAEHVVPHVRWMAGRILVETTRLGLLVTTRQRLAAPDEHTFDLEPLALPEAGRAPADSAAVRMYVDRVRAVRNGYDPDGAELEQIGRLVRELDGLPLAIELCAARARVLTTSDMLERLPRWFQLSRSAADAGSRHSTLHHAIRWSWEQLGPDEQCALMQCSLFQGSFSLDAASALLADDPASAEELLAELVDKSLVRADATHGSRRFAILASVRRFATDELARSPANLRAAQRRHAKFYVRVGRPQARQASFENRATSMRWLALEQGNLAAAHRRLLAGANPTLDDRRTAFEAVMVLVPVRWWEARLHLCLEELDRVRQASAAVELPESRSAAFHVGCAGTLRRLGRTDEALAAGQRALEIADRLGRPNLLAVALVELGEVHLDRANAEAARACFERGLTLFEGKPEPITARLFYGLGVLSALGDDFASALAFFERALSIVQRQPESALEGILTSWMATMEMELGHQRARRRFEQALAIFTREGNVRMEAWTHGHFGLLEQTQGNHGRAAQLYRQAIEQTKRIGDRRHEAIFSGYLGVGLLERNDLPAAMDQLEWSIGISMDLGLVEVHAYFRGWLGVALTRQGDERAAARAFESAAAELPERERVYRQTLAIHRGHLDLLRARSAPSDDEASELRRAASDGLARVPRTSQSDILLAIRVLERALEDVGITPPESRGVETLEIHSSGRWFRPPGGRREELGRRHALRNLLVRLCRARIEAPGCPLDDEALVAEGWPGEKLLAHAAANRLRVAMHTLRKLGLGDHLERRHDGYLLGEAVAVRWVDGSGPV